MDIMEKVLEVKGEDAAKMALQEGLPAGASTVAAIELAKRPENRGKLIVSVHPSAGDRYLPSALFEGPRKEAEAMQPAPVD
ncbi:bifunctional L-3-cyanoalanine synthase/cysteine synthase, mitochondrial isoform X2 [Triticum aestivum]|uniref:bifunctional L-3-cyanoalanine synthase/cysteine synthase, mitochondrial isoform X2 n=1 Tax=Triticum aestivum TaxID=4565 RepID=UPI001D014557|nr:bifunctional L-3-cyanoalanine synthase/cysteine synthase, mitochondrial-like isoform X2 [Triticum aestivum]